MAYLLGISGFLLLYIYEYNLILWKKKFIRLFFSLGFIGLGSSTILATLLNWKFVNLNTINVIVGIGFITIFFVLLIFTLFFSVPFNESYIEQTTERIVYRKGMYALSRHPGVLWFIGMYAGLSILIPTVEIISLSVLLCALNVVYIIIQDMWSFPILFVDYNEYKRETPFLFPTINSIKKIMKR